ncbi:MAG: hypothetical protein WBC18_14705 [Ottowia sp.]|uniref:hypothetical protein n=1 Tax=Ottowia sp. TaxID=1898956 RepID=UPI003C745503
MSELSVDIDVLEYPIGGAGEQFHFKSGLWFLPTLRVDCKGRQEPAIRLWEQPEYIEIPLSVLMNVNTRGQELEMRCNCPRIDGQILTLATRTHLVEIALTALKANRLFFGRYRVVWKDYNVLPNGWPDRNALVDELTFLFPNISPTLPDSDSYHDPIVVSGRGTTADGRPLFNLEDATVLPAFDDWLLSRGFTACVDEESRTPLIFYTEALEEGHFEQEEETGWVLVPISSSGDATQ